MTAEVLAATEHLVLRRMTRRRRRTGGVPKRPGAGPLPVMGDAIPLGQRPGAHRPDAQRGALARPIQS
jgi:hypothetical protein